MFHSSDKTQWSEYIDAVEYMDQGVGTSLFQLVDMPESIFYPAYPPAYQPEQ